MSLQMAQFHSFLWPALSPCKDIRKGPQLPSDLLLYQELKHTREDMRRAGVQLLHCGGQAPTLLC